MTSFLFALLAGLGVHLILSRDADSNGVLADRLAQIAQTPRRLMTEAGLDDVSPAQFGGASLIVGLGAAAVGAMVFGTGLSSMLIGAIAATVPAASWRNRRARRREVALDAWPRMIDELRVLTGAAGRPIPQALIEVGLRGPEELRPAFVAAQREWALTTDFGRTTKVLKERLADPTADVILETLVVAVEVGGDLETRLGALAEDRRQDEIDRKDAAAKQSGAKFARLFVIIVPAGMALAGLSVGDGASAYGTVTGQLLVSAGIALIVVCWIWASRIMRLPQPIRVFDR